MSNIKNKTLDAENEKYEKEFDDLWSDLVRRNAADVAQKAVRRQENEKNLAMFNRGLIFVALILIVQCTALFFSMKELDKTSNAVLMSAFESIEVRATSDDDIFDEKSLKQTEQSVENEAREQN